MIIQTLYQIGCIQFGEFTLKSGEISTIYINLRKIIAYPTLLRQFANALWDTARNCSFDVICGVPYTALPIATCLSLDHNIPMVLRRKEKKAYGTKQIIEGEFKPRQKCLLIEDVITSGSSILETIHDLESVDLQVHDVFALIDREQGGKVNLAPNYRLHALFSLSEVLQTLMRSNLLSEQEQQIIRNFAEKNACQLSH